MKVFLSHNMSRLTEEEVMKIRKKEMQFLISVYGNDIEFIDNYYHDNVPENAGNLWHLGRSIQQLEEADAIYFCRGNDDSRGCQVEKLIVELYGLKVLNYDKVLEVQKK